MEPSYTIKEVIEQRFDEMEKHLVEMKVDGKETKAHTQATNGRVTRLEEWSKEAKAILEETVTKVENVDKDYRRDRNRIIGGYIVLVALGTTIIGLAVNAIDSKIEKGIRTALADMVESVEEAK